MTWDALGMHRYAEPDNPDSPEEYSYLQSDMVRVKGRVFISHRSNRGQGQIEQVKSRLRSIVK